MALKRDEQLGAIGLCTFSCVVYYMVSGQPGILITPILMWLVLTLADDTGGK